MGKTGFFLSVAMIGALVVSLIANIHLYTVNNRLKGELSDLKAQVQDLQHVEFQTIAKGTNSGHRSSAYYVIESDSVWTTVWNQHSRNTLPQPPPPEIDFSDSTVIAVFMGTYPSGGYSIEVKALIETSQSVTVKVEKTYPGMGCGTVAVFTQPCHIVKTEKIYKEIVFETVDRIRECT